MTEPDSPADVDEIRAGVLGALLRNMSIDYAARADGITVAQAEEIARAAGWPDDLTAVMVEHRRLKGIPAQGLPATSLVGPAGVDTRPAAAQPAQVRPRRPARPRPDLSVARVQPTGNLPVERLAQASPDPDPETTHLVRDLAEYCAEVDEVIDAITPEQTEQALSTLLAEREYFGPSATGHIHDRACAQDELFCPDNRNGLTPRPGPGRPLPPATDSPACPVELNPGVDLGALLPPAGNLANPNGVKRSTTRPGPQPCEVCHVPVAAEFIALTGRARHKWHPADAENALDFGKVSDDD